MDGDAYRDPSHYEIQQLIWRKVAQFADSAAVEYRLPNGKIADILYRVKATTVIVEVKTIVRQSLIERAWKKYNTQCDYLVIASPPQLVRIDHMSEVASWEDDRIMRIGLWWVDWLGITEIRRANRLGVKTPGQSAVPDRASTPFTVIASPGCTVQRP